MRLASSPWDWMVGWTTVHSHLRTDIDELRENPAERLTDAPVVIRRFRAWPLMVLTPLLAFALVLAVQNEIWPAPAVAGVALLFIIAYVWFMPQELRLERDGILIRRRGVEVVCSWELFAVDGHPFRAGRWLVLPTNPDAVPMVGMWRRGKIVAEGEAVRTGFFKFDAADQVKLATGLELGPHDLGELLLHVANAVCESAERAAEPPEDGPVAKPMNTLERALRKKAQQMEPNDSTSPPIAVIDWGGRLRVSSTRLLFPPECCICGQVTPDVLRLRAPGRLGVLPTRSSIDFAPPCCPQCSRGEIWRSRVAFVLPALLNAAAWIALLFVVTSWPSTEWHRALGFGVLLSLLTLWLANTLGDWLLGRVWATFLSYRNELEIRFRRREYPGRVVEFLESRQDEPANRTPDTNFT